MACAVRQTRCAWRATAACRRSTASAAGAGWVTGATWAAALGGCEWLESWKLGCSPDDAVLDLVRRLADAPLPDPPPVLRALLGHTLDEVLLRGLTALYSLFGCEEQERKQDGDSDGAAVSATWLDAQYRKLEEDEKRLGPGDPCVIERQATLNELSKLLRQKQSIRDRDTATSTAGTSSWEPSRTSSTAATSDTDAETVRRRSPHPQEQGTEQGRVSEMPDWILPGVAESEEDTLTGAEEGGGRHPKKVKFKETDKDGQATDGEKGSAAQEGEALWPTEGSQVLQQHQSAARPPCECCMSTQPARPSQPHTPCVCTCGTASRVCTTRQSECMCAEPSSEYFTGRGTSVMPSRTDAITANSKRQPAAMAERLSTTVDTAGADNETATKPTDKTPSSAQKPMGEGGAHDTDWHSAASTPCCQRSTPASGTLRARATPCPCCPPRRRRPRGPTNCPEQILWAITKICIFPDASRTYEVLTPTFEKPPRASGRTHVVFAMRPP